MKRDKRLTWNPPFYADGNVIRDVDHEIVMELRGLTHLMNEPNGDMVVERRGSFIAESLNDQYKRLERKYSI